ncbi:hypothetical protein ACODNH_02300 (plasmid) [Haloarcula sp. NS06]|uniref:hypothetical protein n=1 Tax=Haloarcula sp. NS06 TaxID=3409688 RepID=UPI003DA77CA2
MQAGKIIIGVLLITFAVEPYIPLSSGVQSQTNIPPENCDSSPLPRPIPDNSSKPVVGTVHHSQSNESVVHVNYTVRENRENPLTIEIRSGSALIASNGLNQTGPNELSTELNQGDTFSIQYGISDLDQFANVSYTSGENWIIAPTPKHSGPGVGLTPARSGFIGLHALYLGNYTTHSKQAGCQTITIILPAAAEINPEPRLEMLTGAARSINSGKTYADVYVFPSPESLGQRDGFVPKHENEIIISADTPTDSPKNIWIHEYVHTRQIRYDGDDFIWFNEASATYYAARLTLEQGLISPVEYDAQLASFATYSPERNLSSARSDRVAYRWGAVVLARLDTALVDEGSTLMVLFNDWNSYGGPSFSDAMTDLENEGVEQQRLNNTRDTVLKNSAPEPHPAQTSQLQWLPNFVLSQYLKERGLITGILVCLGTYLLASGLTERYRDQD